MLRLPIYIALLAVSLFANSAVVGNVYDKDVREQLQKDKLSLTNQEFKSKYSDTFTQLDSLVLANYYDDLNFTKTNSMESLKNIIETRNTAAIQELFTCPQPVKIPQAGTFDPQILSAKLLSADYQAGTFQCLLIDERYPIGAFQVKIENWNKLLDLDVAGAEEFYQQKIHDAYNFAQAFEIAELRATASMSGYLNKTDVMLHSILGNGDVIDLEATKTTNSIVLKPEYNSLSLSNTTVVESSAQAAQWQDVKGLFSSIKYIFTEVTGVDTTVRITKKLDKMSLAITDNTNLLAATNAGIIAMLEVFNDVSAVYYFALAGLALMFGAGLWAYNSADNPSGKFQVQKGYPIALIFAATMLFPYGNDYKSNFQRAEIDGYTTANSFANDLSLGFIDASFKNIQSQLGLFAKEQIIDAGARKKVEADKTFINVAMVARCQAEGSQYFKAYIEDNQIGLNKNLFGSVQETQNLIAFPLVYNLKTNSGLYETIPTSTISFCSKSYEDYYKASAMFDKYEKVLTSVRSVRVDQISNLIELQYGLYRDFGWVSVLAMPIIKHRLQTAGKLPAQSEIKTDDEEELIQQFANTAILYLVPGAEKIKNLAQDFLSPLSKIPYVGGLLSGAGGALISVLVMDKILGLLPVLAIMIFGAFRLVIILMKIFVFHLFTPFLMIAVIMGKQGKEAVLKYSSYVFATMMELPIFVFGIYALMVMQEYLNGIGHSLAQALNAIYLQAGEDLSAFDMLNNLDYYLLGSLVDVSLRVLSLVLIYRVIFTLHTLILNAIQSQSENTLEQIAESAVQNASRWSNKV
jgi:hypothetical protein